MNWLLLTALGAIFYTGFNLSLKLAGGKVNNLLGALIVALAGLLVMVGVFTYQYLRGVTIDHSMNTWHGYAYSALAGVLVILFDLVLYALFTRNAPISVVIPVIQVSTLALLFLVGVLFLGEAINMEKTVGIMLALVSVYLLAK
ncbi:MAG: hypothetical protein Tsb002_37470 [Wenzhouxiangellaceae bacterium]